MGEHRSRITRTSGMNPWRAGCGESCTSGSEGGLGKPAGGDSGTAPRSDPYTELHGPEKWLVLLPLRRDRYLQPLRGGLAGGSSRIGHAGRATHRGRHLSTRCRRRAADPSCRSGQPYNLAPVSPAPGRSRGPPEPFAAAPVSNDNPYSEAQFKTLKYSPSFPKRFANLAAARSFCHEFFEYYNHEHRHSGIALHTPADVHFGLAEVVREKRQGVLDAAYAAMPGTIPDSAQGAADP